MDELIAFANSEKPLPVRQSQTSGGRYDCLKRVFGDGLFEKLRGAKILVVGAGGIGCELLKNLVMIGIGSLYVIDLDTIDVSNLNRQFLFQKKHVKQPKAIIARESVLKFNPDVKITARLANIFDSEFGLDFYDQFDSVLNALDNLPARNHVNRCCLATGTPLVESGTQGLLGQVRLIRAGKTECFECQKQDQQKTFAVCTIRSTPSRPEHCIVWAKMIAATLFGPHDEDNYLKDLAVEADESESPKEHTQRLFSSLFDSGVKEQIDMEDLWRNRDPPKQLFLKDLHIDEEKHQYEQIAKNTQKVLSLQETVKKFLVCTEKLLQREDVKGRVFGFDKDDKLAMEFVSTASNLRMECYGIKRISEFESKGIAGNIVHAVATANAVCAALQTVEAIKVLGGKFEDSRMVWHGSESTRNICCQILQPPNPKCWVCCKQKLEMEFDIEKFTAKQLLDDVCKARLGMIDPCVDTGNSLIERDLEECDEKELEESLSLFVTHPRHGVQNGKTMSVTDNRSDLKVDLVVKHSPNFAFEEGEPPFKLISHSKGEAKINTQEGNPEDNDVVMKDGEEKSGTNMQVDNADIQQKKKQRTN